jgi:hypothetical protein
MPTGGADDVATIVAEAIKGANEMHDTELILTKVHVFTLIMPNIDQPTEIVVPALHQAGCTYAKFLRHRSTVSLHFERPATTLGNAIGSAVDEVERAGFDITVIQIWR